MVEWVKYLPQNELKGGRTVRHSSLLLASPSLPRCEWYKCCSDVARGLECYQELCNLSYGNYVCETALGRKNQPGRAERFG